MRYLLVAADKSSQLPVEIPDEILTHKSRAKASKVHKTRATPSKPSKKRKRSVSKAHPKKKRKQSAKPIAK